MNDEAKNGFSAGDINNKCCFCQYASPIIEMQTYICKKKGVVLYNSACKKFSFDPLKLSPILPAKKIKFDAEEFTL